MDVTTKRIAIPRPLVGGLRMSASTATFSGTYSAGGDTFKAGILPSTVLAVVPGGNNTAGQALQPRYNATTQRLELWDGATEASGSVDGFVYDLFVFGF